MSAFLVGGFVIEIPKGAPSLFQDLLGMMLNPELRPSPPDGAAGAEHTEG